MADMGRLILDLREKTGAGMMACKKALTEAGGSVDEALTALRKKGLADAAKKSGRISKEGLIAIFVSGKSGAIVELNSETDFVARVDDFKKLADGLASSAASGDLKKPEDAKPAIQPVFERLKENIVLRRFERFELDGPGLIAGYIHLGGKKGSMVELGVPSDAAAGSPELGKLAKELNLQIVAGSPRYLDKEAVPAADVEKEREIYSEQVRAEKKPEAAIPKIVEGKLRKLFFQAFCLSEQLSVRDNKTPIAKMLETVGTKLGGPVKIRRFARFQLGE